MIIDTHVHIGKMLVFDMPPENVLYSMDKYGIDFSFPLFQTLNVPRTTTTATLFRRICRNHRMPFLKKLLNLQELIPTKSVYCLG